MRAFAYMRYSTDKQTENSIAYQMDAILKYCKDHNIVLSGSYSDEAESGTNLDRPGFQALVRAARQKELDTVLIYDISRASRDVADWFSFRKEMNQLEVRVISVTQQLGDVTNPDNFLTELLTAGLGQHMVLQTRQKSIAGVAEKAKQGVFLGGIAPLGYDIENGKYIINEAEAKIVKTIFTMYGNGSSYSKIIDTVKGYKGKRGRPIGKNSLHSILNNERYIGIYFWNKRKMKLFRKWAGGGLNPNTVKIENAIPRIIDDDLWERVRKRMDDNKNRARNKACRREYLLSGMIECASCGSAYVGHTSTNKSGSMTSYYVCGNKYRTRNCQSKNINANGIETFVVQHVQQYLLALDYA